MLSDDPHEACGLTIFALPKPFQGQIRVIQSNSVRSWSRLDCAREIILIGGEVGIEEFALEVGATYHESVRTDRYGTPLLDDAFRIARTSAKSDWLCYANSDIILLPEFGQAVSEASKTLGDCLVVSRRWNLDVPELLDFGAGWQARLRARAHEEAELFTSCGIDVFAFPKSLIGVLPPFSVGRPYWDNWMIAEARRRGVPVVDATCPFGVIHQTHDALIPDHMIRRGQQGLRNFWLAGDSLLGLGHTGDATHQLREGKIQPIGTKTVSVVIPHAGSYSQIRGCLSALSEQSYPRTYVEVIVVENSEQAVTAPVILEQPLVRFTREAKPGPAAARNKGASIAGGDLIAFLDSDCRPAGDWIEKGVEAAVNTDFRSVVACNIVPSDPGNGSSGVKKYEALAYHDQKGYVEFCQACMTGGMFVPKAVWVDVGPFDEQFPEAACEDWEWSTRASSRGVRIVYGEQAVVSHPVHCTWGDLRRKALRQARGEVLLSRLRRRYSDLNLAYQFRFFNQRLFVELRRIFFHSSIPFYSRPTVALAAMLVWFWSVNEARKHLARLSREIIDRSWLGRPRSRFPRGRRAPPASSACPEVAQSQLAAGPE
jgi:GT2 family glycosyltransferase